MSVVQKMTKKILILREKSTLTRIKLQAKSSLLIKETYYPYRISSLVIKQLRASFNLG